MSYISKLRPKSMNLSTKWVYYLEANWRVDLDFNKVTYVIMRYNFFLIIIGG